MEQVLPGVEEDDWDSDPIVEAVDLHRAGFHREAIRLLDDLLAIDRRCVDAWAHLGSSLSKPAGRAPPIELYEVGVAVAEASLPSGFNGVLPRVHRQPAVPAMPARARSVRMATATVGRCRSYVRRKSLARPSRLLRCARLPRSGERTTALETLLSTEEFERATHSTGHTRRIDRAAAHGDDTWPLPHRR